MASIFLYETLDDVDYRIMLVRIHRIMRSIPEFASVFSPKWDNMFKMFGPTHKIKKLFRFRDENLTVRLQINHRNRARNVFMVIDSPNGRDDIQILNPQMRNAEANIIAGEVNNESEYLLTFEPEQLKMEIRDFVADYME